MFHIVVSEYELQFMSANGQCCYFRSCFMSEVEKHTLYGKLCAVWRSSVFFPLTS